MAAALAETPVRDHMDDPKIVWKEEKPDYSVVNHKYLTEKRMKHPVDSLEKIVENLVKTWEMESSHKIRAEDWKTVDPEKFTISTNYGRKFKLADNIEIGNYNMLMIDSPLYDADKETNESSHEIFRKAFKNGFAWELLEVLSGPPVVSFTWRHWGKWEGPYKDIPPNNESLELFGSCIARVSDDLKIQSLGGRFTKLHSGSAGGVVIHVPLCLDKTMPDQQQSYGD